MIISLDGTQVYERDSLAGGIGDFLPIIGGLASFIPGVGGIAGPLISGIAQQQAQKNNGGGGLGPPGINPATSTGTPNNPLQELAQQALQVALEAIKNKTAPPVKPPAAAAPKTPAPAAVKASGAGGGAGVGILLVGGLVVAAALASRRSRR